MKDEYPCVYCADNYLSRYRLRAHVSSQHPKKPARTSYACGFCPQVFTRDHALKRHQDVCHGDHSDPSRILSDTLDPPVECPFPGCAANIPVNREQPKTWASKYLLSRHLRRIHDCKVPQIKQLMGQSSA